MLNVTTSLWECHGFPMHLGAVSVTRCQLKNLIGKS
jgi:hypothetical protein